MSGAGNKQWWSRQEVTISTGTGEQLQLLLASDFLVDGEMVVADGCAYPTAVLESAPGKKRAGAGRGKSFECLLVPSPSNGSFLEHHPGHRGGKMVRVTACFMLAGLQGITPLARTPRMEAAAQCVAEGDKAGALATLKAAERSPWKESAEFNVIQGGSCGAVWGRVKGQCEGARNGRESITCSIDAPSLPAGLAGGSGSMFRPEAGSQQLAPGECRAGRGPLIGRWVGARRSSPSIPAPPQPTNNPMRLSLPLRPWWRPAARRHGRRVRAI
jgi:hypothetical protein